MATHNGARYLRAQLDSLARQTLLPRELVVLDDVSEDETVPLVQDFAEAAPFAVNLIRPPTRRGYARAFLEAARLCPGNLVAFCDQDDVWQPDKLARCAAEFERRQDLSAVVHSARLIGPAGHLNSRSHPAYRRKRITTPVATPILPQLPGFAMVASRRVIDPWSIVDEPRDFADTWDHDDWTMTIASAIGSVAFLPDRLVLYRQHQANVWGAPALTAVDRVRKSIAYRGHETVLHQWTAQWGRAHVRLLERLDERLRDKTGAIYEGPRIRAQLWTKLVEVSERRAELYSMSVPGHRPIQELVAAALRGHYGRRGRGGLGATSLGRDSLHVVGLLG